jgi:hypothetical protein
MIRTGMRADIMVFKLAKVERRKDKVKAELLSFIQA